MRRDVIGWNQTLRSLGYQANWRGFWANGEPMRIQKVSCRKPFSYCEQLAIEAFATDAGQDNVGQWIINWGDGTEQIVDGSIGSGSHSYLTSGNFEVSVQAINEDLKTERTTVYIEVQSSDGSTDDDDEVEFSTPKSFVAQTYCWAA